MANDEHNETWNARLSVARTKAIGDLCDALVIASRATVSGDADQTARDLVKMVLAIVDGVIMATVVRDVSILANGSSIIQAVRDIGQIPQFPRAG